MQIAAIKPATTLDEMLSASIKTARWSPAFASFIIICGL